MGTFFNRNDKTVIDDARALPIDQFVIKYKGTTGLEQLEVAYADLRKKHGVIADIQLPTVHSVNSVLDNEAKSEVKGIRKQAKYLTNRIETRTSRIKELLKAKVKPKDIISQLADEGFIVHAPQITAVAKGLQNANVIVENT